MMPAPLFPRIAIAALTLCLCAGASAQTYKCLDSAGKVTYSSTACADLGLRDGGEVRDKLNLSPAQKVEPRQAVPPPERRRPPGTTTSQGSGATGAKQETSNPVRRCFKTANGTRCNDDPGVPDPVPTDERAKSENKAGN